MCDYSLHSINSRLALELECLRVHRFPAGSIGLAPEIELDANAPPQTSTLSLWKNWFRPESTGKPCAVSIPPSARLLLFNIPPRLQSKFALGGFEHVRFTQVTADANRDRDAVECVNGKIVLLQQLRPGMRAQAPALIASETANPELDRLPVAASTSRRY